MKFTQGQDRSQTHLFPVSLDQTIDPENEVRLIDLFVDSMDPGNFGFDKQFIENGRPAYHPSDLLKLYIYGYMNKVRIPSTNIVLQTDLMGSTFGPCKKTGRIRKIRCML